MLLVEDERLANLIELGVANHPDPERVNEAIRKGAQFVVRHAEDEDRIEVGLVFNDTAPVFAAMRAEMAGCDPEPVDHSRDGEYISVIKAPVSVLAQPPQG
jgi:hypothetical protein